MESYFVLDRMSFCSYQGSDGETILTCRHCFSPNLITDCKEGDVICTDCGIVAEEKVRDASSDWRVHSSNNDDQDAFDKARSGMVPNNESRWIGGLEPTSLSKIPFCGGNKGSSIVSKRLKVAHRKTEKGIEKEQMESWKEAVPARKILAKRREERMKQQQPQQQPLQQEQEETLLEDAEAYPDMACSTNSMCGSLDCALLLHDYEEQHGDTQMQQHQVELLGHLTSRDKRNLRSLYLCFSLMKNSCLELSLSNPEFLKNSANTLCQYSKVTNGLLQVRGAVITNKSKPLELGTNYNESAIQKLQRMGALVSAIIYIHSKRIEGCSRSLAHVCNTINHQCRAEFAKQHPGSADAVTVLVLPRTCSKAISELKIHIPDLFHSENPDVSTDSLKCDREATTTNDNDTKTTKKNTVATVEKYYTLNPTAYTAANLVHHAVINVLKLPQEACSIIRHLAIIIGKEQMEDGVAAGTKPSAICTALTYLICSAGSIMQRLARQAVSLEDKVSSTTSVSISSSSTSSSHRYFGNVFPESFDSTKSSDNCTSKCTTDANVSTAAAKSNLKVATKDHEMYDLISLETIGSVSKVQDNSILLGWNEWIRQTSWDRKYTEIERACCGERKYSTYEYYKSHVFPRRVALLEMANDALISVLSPSNRIMTNISTAAPLMVAPPKKPQ